MNAIIKRTASNGQWVCIRLLSQTIVLAMVLTTALVFVQPVYAAGISVNTTTDELNNDGDCSLREAIQAANTNAAVDACVAGSSNDIIYLPSGTYTININGSSEDANATGDFDITAAETLVIIGSGSNTTFIDGGFGDRVLHLTNAGGTLQLVSLTIQNGLTFDEPGAGVLSWGTLVLNYVTVQQNGVLGSSAGAAGGGLCVGCITGTGYLTIYDSVIRNNSARIAGGIFTNVIALIERSNIISNTASLNPGGIANYGTLTIYNSLVSDNTANALGASGIFNQGTLTLSNSTISHNLADPGFTGIANSGTVIISNTILANNTPLNCANASSFSSQGYNLSSDNSCSTFLNAPGDINNTDPMLGTLQQNGIMYFRPLLPGSPAIDAGNNSSCVNFDQFSTHRPLDGDGNGTRLCDIGAYELPGATFVDVPITNFAWNFVERLYTSGITGGCGISPLAYCPENTVTRAQMAIFLLRGMHGSSYMPPAAAGNIFGDVPATHWAANWIEQLYAESITGGCGAGSYCPEQSVTRAQMAIFLLRAKHGAGYLPPAVGAGTGFGDVPTSHWAAAWIKQLAAEGITTGCGANNYCPEQSVTRAQMAIFLVRTFGLP